MEKIGRVIEQNVEQAQHLVARIQAELSLELLAPAPLNVVCFRCIGETLAEPKLDVLNRQVLVRLQEDGIAIPSSTRRLGRFALRVAITNHRTRRKDIDVFVDAVLELARELAPG